MVGAAVRILSFHGLHTVYSNAINNVMVNKWQHDGADQHESWWYGPIGCEVSEALGSVHPEWSETRATGVGKPDRWVARAADGTRIDHATTRREATAIVERYLFDRRAN
jgi:hypothetical protein